MVVTTPNSLGGEENQSSRHGDGVVGQSQKLLHSFSQWYFSHFFFSSQKPNLGEKINNINNNNITLFQLSLPLNEGRGTQLPTMSFDISKKHLAIFGSYAQNAITEDNSKRKTVPKSHSKLIFVWEMKQIYRKTRKSQRDHTIITRFSTPKGLRRGANTP